jgi:hypothetical protein
VPQYLSEDAMLSFEEVQIYKNLVELGAGQQLLVVCSTLQRLRTASDHVLPVSPSQSEGLRICGEVIDYLWAQVDTAADTKTAAQLNAHAQTLESTVDALSGADAAHQFLLEATMSAVEGAISGEVAHFVNVLRTGYDFADSLAQDELFTEPQPILQSDEFNLQMAEVVQSELARIYRDLKLAKKSEQTAEGARRQAISEGAELRPRT